MTCRVPIHLQAHPATKKSPCCFSAYKIGKAGNSGIGLAGDGAVLRLAHGSYLADIKDSGCPESTRSPRRGGSLRARKFGIELTYAPSSLSNGSLQSA